MALALNIGKRKEIKISELTGKMAGINSLSTSPLLNEGCKKNRTIEGSVCQKCYSTVTLKRYKNLRNMLERNTDVLTSEVFDMADIPYINGKVFRFESHGDVQNNIHLENLCRIAEKNSETTFTLWTKHIQQAENFFDNREKPANFILIYSSIMLNNPINDEKLNHNDKIFTVYTKDHIKENDININCGAKDCSSCRLCYTHNDTKIVNEILK